MPRSTFSWIAVLLLAGAACGCGDMKSDLVVRPDGSGRMVLVEVVTDLPGLAKRYDPDGRHGMAENLERLSRRHAAVRERDIRELVAAMGAGARLTTYNCHLYQGDKIAEYVVIEIDAINKTNFAPVLFLNLPPSPDREAVDAMDTAKPPPAPAGNGGEANAAAPVAAVELDGETVRIKNYWQGDAAGALAGSWFTERRRDMARAALPFMKGRSLRVTVAMENGRVAETNARHRLADDSGVVLANVPMDAFLEALLDDAKRAELEKIRDIPDPDEQLRAAENLVPGLAMDGAREIIVRFE